MKRQRQGQGQRNQEKLRQHQQVQNHEPIGGGQSDTEVVLRKRGGSSKRSPAGRSGRKVLTGSDTWPTRQRHGRHGAKLAQDVWTYVLLAGGSCPEAHGCRRN
jgi:hypothetical protein